MKNLEQEHSEKRLQLENRSNKLDSKRPVRIASTIHQILKTG